MDLRIEADRLVGPNVTHVATTKRSGKMTPKFLVLHYTASDNYDSDVRVLSTSTSPASAHLVVAPDGRITQIGDFKDALWHAGKSSWKGFSGLNQHSIGIEVTCPGPIDRDQARYGAKLKDGDPYGFTAGREPNGGAERKWAIFTDEQIAILREVGRLIMDYYNLREAVAHHQIAPDRKIDPGPSCPQSVYDFLNGNAEDEEEPERPDLKPIEQLKVNGVAPETLNFRISPNGAIRPGSKGLPEGTPVEVLNRRGSWAEVRTPAGIVGWVWSTYLAAA